KCEWFLTRENADVRHTDHGKPVPAFGAQRATRSVGTDGVSGFTRAEKSGEQAVRDDRSALRGNAFIIECERSETGTMFLAGIRHYVHQVAAIAEPAQLVEREERCAGEAWFHAKHAAQLDGMADRLVNLQPQLRALENDGEHALRTLPGFVQRNGF